MMKTEVTNYIAENFASFSLIELINLNSAISRTPDATLEQIKELISRKSRLSGNSLVFEDAVAAGGIAIKMMRGNKGDGFLNHSHDYDHITLVAKGSVLFNRGDTNEHEHFGVGIVVTEKNVQHEYICAEDDTFLCCLHRTDQMDSRGQEYLLVEDKHVIGDWNNGE